MIHISSCFCCNIWFCLACHELVSFVPLIAATWCKVNQPAGQPQEETQFSYVPPSAAIQVYGCGVLITIGAALCFSSRQRRNLQNEREDGGTNQFIQQSNFAAGNSSCVCDKDSQELIQPLLPESAV